MISNPVIAVDPFTWRTEVARPDIDGVRRLVHETGFFRNDEIDVAVELVEERLKKRDASGYHFLLLDDAAGFLAGYVCFGPIACTIGSFDLYWVAVDPSHQGRGLGRALVRAAEDAVRTSGGRRMYIETSSQPKYEPTRRFYASCGYAIDATLRDFYAPGDDKLIYSRAVDQ